MDSHWGVEACERRIGELNSELDTMAKQDQLLPLGWLLIVFGIGSAVFRTFDPAASTIIVIAGGYFVGRWWTNKESRPTKIQEIESCQRQIRSILERVKKDQLGKPS